MSTIVTNPTATAQGSERIGLEDVLRSARQLARESRGLAESTAGVLERELAMALTVAESLRDKLVSPAALEQSRAHPLMARLRTEGGNLSVSVTWVIFSGFKVTMSTGMVTRVRTRLRTQFFVLKLPRWGVAMKTASIGWANSSR